MKTSRLSRAAGLCRWICMFGKSRFADAPRRRARARGPWYGAAVLALGLTGCAPYAQVQIDLLDHSRQGIVNAKATQSSFAAAVDQLHALRRKQLDTAFDADVREQPAVDAEWIIEHRRAYAAALEAMAQQQLADHQTADTAQRNLDAIDQALAQIRSLQSVPLSWFGSK